MSIKAGDLVMVVRPSPCCGNFSDAGRIFRVKEIMRGPGRCPSCLEVAQVTAAMIDHRYGLEVFCLKRIDPPSEGDSLPTRKDLEVPA